MIVEIEMMLSGLPTCYSIGGVPVSMARWSESMIIVVVEMEQDEAISRRPLDHPASLTLLYSLRLYMYVRHWLTLPLRLWGSPYNGEIYKINRHQVANGSQLGGDSSGSYPNEPVNGGRVSSTEPSSIISDICVVS